MPYFETTIDIAAPPEQVWPVLSRVTEWPRWTPTVRAVTPLDEPAADAGGDDDEAGHGQRYRVEQPRLRPAVYTITSLTPQAAFTWEARQPGLRIVAEHRVMGHGISGTRVTLSIAFKGVAAPFVWPFVRRIACDYLTLEARSLKAHVEGTGAS